MPDSWDTVLELSARKGPTSAARALGSSTPRPQNYNDLVSKYTADDPDDFKQFALSIHHAEYSPTRWVSKAGAIGPMQLMPETAKGLGVDPNDPEQNVKGGTTHLRSLYQKYRGNKVLAAAAYNAGEAAVEKYGGVPPYRETKDYVRKVNGGTLLAQSNKPLSVVDIWGDNFSQSEKTEIPDQKTSQKAVSKNDPQAQAQFNKLLGIGQERIPGAKPLQPGTIATAVDTRKLAKSNATALSTKTFMGPAISPTTTPPVIRPTGMRENQEAADYQAMRDYPILRAIPAGIDSLTSFASGVSEVLESIGKGVSANLPHNPTVPQESIAEPGLFAKIGSAINDYHGKQSQFLSDTETSIGTKALDFSGELAAQLGVQIAGSAKVGVPLTFAVMRAMQARGNGVSDPLELAKQAAIGYGEGLLFKGSNRFVKGPVSGTAIQAGLGSGLAAAHGGGAEEILKGAATQAGLHVGLGGVQGDARRAELIEQGKQIVEQRAAQTVQESKEQRSSEITGAVPKSSPSSEFATEIPDQNFSNARRTVFSPHISDGQPLGFVGETDNTITIKTPSGKERLIPKGSELASSLIEHLDERDERTSGLDLVQAGRDLYSLGVRFKDWAEGMREKFGPGVEDSLPRLFDKARQVYQAERENDKLAALALSKVKHENGDPIPVYHGSPHGVAIEKVDFGKLNPDDWIQGFFTTQASEVTAGYAESSGKGKRAYTAEEKRQLIAETANRYNVDRDILGNDFSDLMAGKWGYAEFDSPSVTPSMKAAMELYNKIVVEGKQANPNVHKFYLDIRNPLDLDAPINRETQERLSNVMRGDNSFTEQNYDPNFTGQDLHTALVEAAQLSGRSGIEYANDRLRKLGYDGATHIGGESKAKTFTDRAEAEREARRTGGELNEGDWKIDWEDTRTKLQATGPEWEYSSKPGMKEFAEAWERERPNDLVFKDSFELLQYADKVFQGKIPASNELTLAAHSALSADNVSYKPKDYSVRGHRVWIAFHPDQVISATGESSFAEKGAAPLTREQIASRFDPERGVLRFSGFPIVQAARDLARFSTDAFKKLAPESVQSFAKAAAHFFAPAEFAPEEIKDVLFSARGLAEKAEARLSGLIQNWDREFSRIPLPNIIDALDRHKTGQPQTDPELQKKFDFFRHFDDQLFLSINYSTLLKDPRAARLFAQLPPSDPVRIEFLRNLAEQTPQSSPALQAIADKFPQSAVGALTHFIDDHFRILWKTAPKWANDTDPFTGAKIGRRPLQGSKGFQRQRQLANFSDGLITIMRGDYGEWGALLQRRGLQPGVDFRASNSAHPTVPPGAAPGTLPAVETDILPLSRKGFDVVKALSNDSAYSLKTVRFGGEPISWNPATLFKLSYADAYRFISANSLWKRMGDDGLRMFLPQNDPIPAGFVELNDKIAQSYFRVPAPGFQSGIKISLGRWIVQENLGEMLNNHLGRDALLDVHSAENNGQRLLAYGGKSLRAIKNAYTSIELGLSPFHAMAESLEVVGSTAGLGFRKLAQGDILGGVRDLATAYASPIKVFKEGAAARKVITDPQTFLATPEGQALLRLYPNAEQLVSDMLGAGAIPYRYKDYRTNFINSYLEHKTSGATLNPLTSPIQTLFRAPAAALESITAKLFDVAIPNWKMGLFMREFSLALKENDLALARGDMTRGQLARKTWNFVEHRMGELNMDNFYWERTLKTGTQIFVRSFPWVYGNLAAGANVVPDLVRLTETLTGERTSAEGPIIGQNLAWLAGMSLYTAVTGGLIMKIMTGLWPGQDRDKSTKEKKWNGFGQAWKDSINPRIDELDSQERILIPTMWREYQSLAHAMGKGPGGLPLEYVDAKLAGWIHPLIEDWKNEKFDKSPVSYDDDGVVRQIAARVFHLLPAPIGPMASVKSYQRTHSVLESIPYALGATRSPYFVRFSPAEELTNQFVGESLTPAEKTRNVWERRAALKDLKQTLKHEPEAFPAQLSESVIKGKVRGNDIAHIIESQQTSPLVAGVKLIPLNKALKVLEVSSLEERRMVLPLILQKLNGQDFLSMSQAQQLSVIDRVLKTAQEIQDSIKGTKE